MSLNSIGWKVSPPSTPKNVNRYFHGRKMNIVVLQMPERQLTILLAEIALQSNF